MVAGFTLFGKTLGGRMRVLVQPSLDTSSRRSSWITEQAFAVYSETIHMCFGAAPDYSAAGRGRGRGRERPLHESCWLWHSPSSSSDTYGSSCADAGAGGERVAASPGAQLASQYVYNTLHYS